MVVTTSRTKPGASKFNITDAFLARNLLKTYRKWERIMSRAHDDEHNTRKEAMINGISLIPALQQYMKSKGWKYVQG